MIINEKIEIIVNNRNVSHYKKLNYIFEKGGDKILIEVKDLPKNSSKRVKVECDICGKKYTLTYQKYNKNISVDNELHCKSCNNIRYKKSMQEKYGEDNPSKIKECNDKRKKTCLERYDSEYVISSNYSIEKAKTTNMKLYGSIYPTQNQEIKNKIKQTCLEHFGVEHHMYDDNIKEKIKKTNLERYGVENPQQNKEIRERTERTNLERYGVRKPLMNDDIKIKLKETQKKKIKENYNDLNIIKIDDEMNIFIKCDKGHIYKTRTSTLYDRLHSETILCTKCNPMNSYSTSGKEKELIEFIKENYNKEILLNDRNIIKPYEIDIFLPELNIAFEFNGVYWHNELYKDKDYHFNKYNECKKQSIFLFQIYEDDWIYKKDIVKSMILNKIKKTKNKIYARKTEVKEINDNKLIRKFLDTNHIQGFSSSSIKIGLFFDDKLVSLMTFKKKNNDFELNRFCNLLNTNVIGGASKLLSYFINQYKFNIITTFSNNNYSDGSLYKTLNFKYLYDLKPDYSYVIKDKRKHKFNFRGTNEKKRMLENKIYRIYDAGKIKFHFTKKIK